MTSILRGKKAVITGASQGFGYAVAHKYIKNGADVLICSRNEHDLTSSHSRLIEEANSFQQVLALKADISSESDVQNLFNYSLTSFGGCDILINNAGIYGPIGPLTSVSAHSWIEAINVNLVGSFLVCKAFIPHFMRQSYGKIIQLSGGGATQPMANFSSYACSKAAVVRLAETLSQELTGTGIDVNAIAPGPLNTRLLDEVISSGPGKAGQAIYKKALVQRQNGGASLDIGADLCVFLGSSASDGISGKIISALWDNWSIFPDYVNEIMSSDVYTLRRIVGRDRNLHLLDL